MFGAWGETSEEVHSLVQRIAKSRQELVETLPGRRVRPKTRAAELTAVSPGLNAKRQILHGLGKYGGPSKFLFSYMEIGSCYIF